MRRVLIGVLIIVCIGIGYVVATRTTDATAAARSVLVGVWQSTDDAKYSREFTAEGKVIEHYEGMPDDDRGRWTLFTKDVPALDYVGPELQDGVVYLGIAIPEESALFFSITSIDADALVLTYLDRGNTLSFKKQ